MRSAKLLEDSESVIEILWDIAIGLYVVKIGFIYFLATLVSWELARYVLSQSLASLTNTVILDAKIPLLVCQLILVIFWTRFVVVLYEVPRFWHFRLGIGALGLALMALSNSSMGLLMGDHWRHSWMSGFPYQTETQSIVLLGVLFLAPSISMIIESSRRSKGQMEYLPPTPAEKSTL